MRYGMNPHQAAELVSGDRMRIINGDPSMINYLDALNAFQLVWEADRATGRPTAASFKHVSPAGAALAGTLDSVTAGTWRLGMGESQSLASAYGRARDADPKSSFGDIAAFSRPVDRATAELLQTVICDGVVAPGYEHDAADLLATKRSGNFLVLEADVTRSLSSWERREVLGMTLVQERDALPVEEILSADALSPHSRADALLGLATVRYTQSNSVAFVRDGAVIGVGAGQQNRVDCVRLAGAKARTWWLRRHPFVAGLPMVEGMGRQDRLNWQIRFAGREMVVAQLAEFEALFGPEARARYDEPAWREEWSSALSGVTMVSDGYLPFADNVDHAAAYGVGTIIEPGGSIRTDEVADRCRGYGMNHVQTGTRLFHH